MHGLKFAVEGSDASFRAAALRTLGNMSDISDDEDSPNFERIHADHSSVDQAMVAYNFIRALQSGSPSSTRFSTNTDSLYNALGAGRYVPGAPRNDANDSSENSESDTGGETRSQALRRYQDASMDEISDLELWAELR